MARFRHPPVAAEMTPSIHFHHADTAYALASDLADFVAQRLREGLHQRGKALLIVSGGSTPVPFFEALSAKALDWPNVVVTLADERWVPEDHADSNARLLKAHLFRGDALQARFVPLFNGAATPESGAAEVEKALAGLPWPADVTVLGMGGDGHTASLFPHGAELQAALHGPPTQRCLAVAAPALPNVPLARITMSKAALLDARQVVAHITGHSKLVLLKQAMADGPVEALPIRLALHQGQVPCDIFQAD